MSHIKLTSGVAVDGTVAYEKKKHKKEIYLKRSILLDGFQQEMNQIFHPAYIFAFDTAARGGHVFFNWFILQITEFSF